MQGWLESTYLLSIPVSRSKLRTALDRLGLLYRPKGPGKLLVYEGSYKAAWAGGTALALLAELEYFRATGDNRFAELRSGWLEGLGTLRVPGGGVRDYPDSIEETAYGNGEAWLALATYADIFRDDGRARELLSGYDDHVMDKYSAEPNRQFYSWGTMAAARRLATTSDAKFVKFISAQANHFVDLEFLAVQRRENTCAFVEGLATAAAVLARRDGHQKLMKRLTARIDREMDKNRALQIRPGLTELDFPEGASFRSAHLADYAGAFLGGGTSLYVRVDITGHCLNALIEMQSITGAR
jgi:hypothetical protein